MLISTINVMSIPEAWWACMRQIFIDGIVYTIERGSFEGHLRREFDLAVINIQEPGIRPLVPNVPIGVPAPTSMEYIEQYLPYLMAEGKADNEDYTYGMYLAPQISKVIEMLRNSGQTNQAYLTVGDPNTIDMKDPPCLRGIQCRIRYGKLHFIVYFRSWDLWAGFPSNLAALQLMKEDMAKELSIPDGSLMAVSPGLHLYDHSWKFAKMVLGESECSQTCQADI